ncbi:B3 domain-containing transcription factor VRN1-like [Carya illinoinensis]|uniref:TF-B3 domain-containing protein n=1 Tax=Carya illinoinensis TaxID=32201 RepID=A0A8T1QMS9_CARIL|nr:B3 domain-containing transcription factor VRN1-like [Carya illinoinensis]KAG6655735.1 hypothetical protein CIPAW_05G236600 [Carya illinoinensis]
MSAKPKTRRTGVVSNGNRDHRPSSSQLSCRPSHFFKIILPSCMHDMKLSLPEKFVRKFGDELSTVAVLTVPNGCVWRVGLEIVHKKIWFREGWQDFVEYLSIQQGYLLVFKYKGNSSFHVLIFDMTATEIHYPSNRKDFKLKDLVDITECDGVKDSRQVKAIENETHTADELSAKRGKDVEMNAVLPRGRNVMFREREFEAATMFKTENPYFIRILRPYNLNNSFLILPTEFAKKYLKGLKFVKLQASDGRQWHCLVRGINGATLPVRIGKGWRTFCKDNQLNEGDICVFELIRRKDVVLKVSKIMQDN